MASFTPPPRVFDPTFRDLVRDANPLEDLINADLINAGQPPLSGHGDELGGWHPIHGSQSGRKLPRPLSLVPRPNNLISENLP